MVALCGKRAHFTNKILRRSNRACFPEWGACTSKANAAPMATLASAPAKSRHTTHDNARLDSQTSCFFYSLRPRVTPQTHNFSVHNQSRLMDVVGVKSPLCTRVHSSPDVYVADELLTPWECQRLITVSNCELACRTEDGPSAHGVCHQCVGFQQAVPMSRIQNLAPLVSSAFEPFGMVRYRTGGKYDFHYDHLTQGDLSRNRTVAILVYLNDSAAVTYFPKIGLRVRPKAGRCLIFFPCFVDGTPDLRTLHAGMPVANGEKYVLQVWARQPVQRTPSSRSCRSSVGLLVGSTAGIAAACCLLLRAWRMAAHAGGRRVWVG